MNSDLENSLIPLVDYDSYEEYEILLDNLVQEYKDMVEQGVHQTQIDRWCCYYGGSRKPLATSWHNTLFKIYKRNGETMVHVHEWNSCATIGYSCKSYGAVTRRYGISNVWDETR